MKLLTGKKISAFLILCGLCVYFYFSPLAQMQTTKEKMPPPFTVKRIESAETWRRDGLAAIERAKAIKPNKRSAKNVILFLGDGMGVTTLTASRVL